jgi:hypothetical protein
MLVDGGVKSSAIKTLHGMSLADRLSFLMKLARWQQMGSML